MQSRKLEAIRTMYRMIDVFYSKRKFIQSAGLEYRMSFFDVVFELVLKERYQKIIE